MPLMANYIYADGVNPFTLVFLRNLFSLVPLAILAYCQGGTLKLSLKLLPKISLISVLGCCATPILLFCSYQYIPSGTATVFHFAYPAFVVIGCIVFFREKVKVGNLLCLALCVAGISLFYTPGQPLDLTGSLLALASAVTFAAYVIILSRFDRSNISAFLFTFYITAVSTVASFLVCIFTGSLALPNTLMGWGLCVLFSLLITTCAVVLFQQSAFLIGGQRTSILSTLEPITSLIIGVIVFHEALGLPVIIGSILVISASLLTAALDIRQSKQKA